MNIRDELRLLRSWVVELREADAAERAAEAKAASMGFTPGLGPRVEALEAKLADPRMTAQAVPLDLGPTEQRIATLNTRVDGQAQEIAALAARVAKLEANLVLVLGAIPGPPKLVLK